MAEESLDPMAVLDIDASSTAVDMTHLSGLSRLETLEWLETEEQRTLSYLLAVRTSRNSVACIHRLPHEILAEIIFLVANSRSPSSTNTRGTPWITLTHVCRLWRRVAFRHAALWRSIDCGNLDRAKVFYQRSKSCMLDVQLTSDSNPSKLFPTHHMTGFVEFLREASSRIARLEIDLEPENMIHLLPHLTFPFPRIRFLSVCISMGLERGSSLHQPPIPFTALQTEQSVLEELTLECVFVPCWSLEFKNLRSLTLYLQRPLPDTPAPTMEEFLNFLDGFTARLEILRFIESGPSLSSSMVHYTGPTRTISLPMLEEFSMTRVSVPEDIPYLLAHLILPKSVQILLSTFLVEPENGLHTVLPRERAGLTSLSIIDELTFELAHGTACLLITGRVSSQPRLGLGQLSITLYWGGDEADFGTTVTRSFGFLKEVFSPANVTTFSFEGDLTSFVDTDSCVDFLHHFSNIEELNFLTWHTFDEDSFPAPIWAALRSGRDRDSGQAIAISSDSPLLCPNLRQLSIESFENESPTGSKKNGRTWDWKLYECLRARYHHSIPSRLEKLILVGEGPEWNRKLLLQNADTGWPAILDLVDEFEVADTQSFTDDEE